MKMGQWLASRPDILSKKTCDKLSNLHDIATLYPFPSNMARNFILTSKIPIGSGCIAQVYKGVYENKFVAIKVLHPNIRTRLERDLNLFEKITSFFIDPDFMKQFRVDVRNQLDLRIEADNLKILKHNFKGYKNVKIPDVYFSSENILIEEYLELDKISNIKVLPIVQNLVCKMLFRDRFVHCDLHPGNILMTKNKEIALIDAGMCQYLSKSGYHNLIDLLYEAFFSKNYYEVGKLLIERHKYQRVIDEEIFKKKFGAVLFKDWNFREAFSILRKHNVKLDYSYGSIMMSLVCVDGIMKNVGKGKNRNWWKVFYINSMYMEVGKKMVLNFLKDKIIKRR